MRKMLLEQTDKQLLPANAAAAQSNAAGLLA